MVFNLMEKFQHFNKKKFSIVFLVFLLAVLGITSWYEYSHIKRTKMIHEFKQSMSQKLPSEYSVGMNYEEAVKVDKPILVLFYADWCRYCIKFMPIFEQVAKKYEENLVFSKVNVEDERYRDLVEDVRIGGFPTVYILDKKYDNKVLISNAFLSSVEDMSIELDRFLRIRKLLDSGK